MKNLLVMRHAKSSWDDPNLDDHDRPLNRRGLRDAPRMGEHARRNGLTPDQILSSTACRAYTTAAMFAEASEYSGSIERLEELYVASVPAFIDAIVSQPPQCRTLLLVSHCPGVETLVQALSGSSARMPTCALAHLQVDAERWEDLSASPRQLIRVWRPKDLS